MQVQHSSLTSMVLYCTDCGKQTDHFAHFFILDEGHSHYLRKCKVCEKEHGKEVLRYLTDEQKHHWQEICHEKPQRQHYIPFSDDEQH